MLYDEKSRLINIETNDKKRMQLFNEVVKKLDDKISSVDEYIGIKINEYFNHYEEQDKEAHLKAAYILGGTWEETPIQNVYDVICEIFQDHGDISTDKAKEIAGCLIRRYMIKDDQHNYLGTYMTNGYVYSRESI